MRSIRAKLAAIPVIVISLVIVLASLASACHGVASATYLCNTKTGQQDITKKVLFPLDDPSQDWQKPGVVMKLVDPLAPGESAPNGITATRGNSITVLSHVDGASTASINWAPKVAFVKPDGSVIQTVTAQGATIKLSGNCKAPVPTSVTGAVNTSSCNSSNSAETFTVTGEVKGEPGTTVNMFYSWTATGHTDPDVPLKGIDGNTTFGIGSFRAEVQTPVWAEPGMNLTLDVNYVVVGSNEFPAPVLTHSAVKAICAENPPPPPKTPAPTPVVNPPAPPAPAPQCKNGLVWNAVTKSCDLPFTDRALFGFTIPSFTIAGITFPELRFGGFQVWQLAALGALMVALGWYAGHRVGWSSTKPEEVSAG